MVKSERTTDHDVIRKWVERRGGHPAAATTGRRSGNGGSLRIEYPGVSGRQNLREISWDEFFNQFDEAGLSFEFSEAASRGRPSSKLVSSSEGRGRAHARHRPAPRGGQRRAARRGAGRGRTEAAPVEMPEAERDDSLDATVLLEEQHQAAKQLFENLLQSQSPAAARRVLMDLAQLLDGHAVIEERHFYPLLEGDTDQVEHSFEEHAQVKMALAELVNTPLKDPGFKDRVQELRDMFTQHSDMEERELFPIARKKLGYDQLAGIAQEMTATLVDRVQEGDPQALVERAAEEARWRK